jgi:arginase family enzyme
LENTDSASVEDSAKNGVEDGPQAVAEDSTGSELTELDIEQGEVDEADEVTEEEEDESSEEQTVSSKDMEHSVIVVAPQRCGGKISFSPLLPLSLAED